MNYYRKRVKEGKTGEFPISETECYIFFRALERTLETLPESNVLLEMKRNLQEHIGSYCVQGNNFKQWVERMRLLHPEEDFIENKIIEYEIVLKEV